MTQYNDAPLAELAESAEKVIEDGGLFFFKWTCGKCGDRVTATEPNQLTEWSKHDDCGYITHTATTGGNYMVIKVAGKDAEHALDLIRDLLKKVTS